MANVTMYFKSTCPFCKKAEALLNERGVADINKIDIQAEAGKSDEMIQRSGRSTVPQIWIGDKHVGGCDDLVALDQSGKLQDLLKA